MLELTPRVGRNRTLVTALLLAVVVHVLMLGVIKFDVAGESFTTTRTITLRTHAEVPTPKEKEVIEEPHEAPREEEPSETTDTIAEIPVEKPSAVNSVPNSETPKRNVRGVMLFQRTLAAVRARVEHPEPEGPRTFSVEDFPAADPFVPGVAETKEQAVVSAQGMTTTKLKVFGREVCMQQRAVFGSEPLWYLVPASTCGHLRSP